MAILGWITKLLGGGILDRALDTVDKKIENEANRDKNQGRHSQGTPPYTL